MRRAGQVVGISLLLLGGCTHQDFISGGTATLGTAMQTSEGIAGAANDFRIRAKINDLWFRYDIKTFASLTPTVNDGSVLLTGIVPTPAQRLEAVRLVWQVEGVAAVINEIKVGEGGSWRDKARDAAIAARLRMDLALDDDIYAINYSEIVVGGTVYMTGFARDHRELNEAIEVARVIPGVRQVVGYVRLAKP